MDFSKIIENQTDFTMVILGPGYGESILLKAPDSDWIVIDCFKFKSRVCTLDFLKSVNGLCECVLVSHPHDDHIAGIEQLLDEHSDCIVGLSGPFLSGEYISILSGGNARFGLSRIQDHWEVSNQALRWDLASGSKKLFGKSKNLSIEVLYPDQTAKNNFNQSSNKDRNSIASPLHVTWNQLELILGSDLERQGWQKINASKFKKNQLHLLKVSHHASKNAQDKRLLSIGPERLVTTPYDRGNKLPRFEDNEGVHFLVGHQKELRLTSLPMKYDSSKPGPIKIKRSDVIAGKVPGQIITKITNKSSLEEMVVNSESRDGWIAFYFNAQGKITNEIHSKGTIIVSAETKGASVPKGKNQKATAKKRK